MKETIKTIDAKTVESSLGWSVHITAIDSCQYQEYGKSIIFEIEDRPDDRGEIQWILYLPAIWIWKSPDHAEPVDEKRIPEIINRINLAFWKLDMNIKEIV